ncbi:competence protein CoiA family protein [Phyllobacterium sp. LjRoot231]
MKFAIVDGLRCEAQPKLRGQCPCCNAEVVAKCGTRKVWHWAHVSIRNCDHWWEPETEWHRAWKNEFPVQCQEVRQTTPDGELHIADVRTEEGTVLEFQHSNISPSERMSREHFYGRMVWVVDGNRLRRDLPSFQTALVAASRINVAPLTLLLQVLACPLLERWSGSRCPVYADFGNAAFGRLQQINEPVLWRLEYLKQNSRVTATPVSRRSFIEHHRDNGRLRGYRLPSLRGQEARRRRRF